jgi:lipoate-protein ligase B
VICQLHDLGLIDYDAAWGLQDRLAGEIARGERPPTLLLLEHPHTYTFGRSGQAANLLWGEDELTRHGAAVRWVDRGGDVTYHGPGQLVGYPLIPLGQPPSSSLHPPPASPQMTTFGGRDAGRKRGVDYVGYIRDLEKALIVALANLGLGAGQIKGLTGVWIQADVFSRCPRCKPEDRQKPAKIAAIGVKVDARGVTRHGFALNVAPDMTYFDGIIPCGLPGHPVVSIQDLLTTVPSMDEVKQKVAEAFGDAFGYEMLSLELEESRE